MILRSLKSWEKKVLKKFVTEAYVRTCEEESLIDNLKEFDYLITGFDLDIMVPTAVLTKRGLNALRN